MKRPSFIIAWNASMRVYDPVDPMAKAAKVIGGYVAININAPPPKNWKNACAIRMSYILNYSGVIIPSNIKKTVSGADKMNYFFRVPDVLDFLKRRWGNPDEIISYPPSGGGVALAGKKGVILFEVSGWSNAQGHATLFDGHTCYDHCYFNEPEVNYHTDQANFWSLPQ